MRAHMPLKPDEKRCYPCKTEMRLLFYANSFFPSGYWR